MKIKGVTGGKNKGNPIEFSPQEKPEVVLKAEVPLKADEGQLWYVTKVSVADLHYSARGTKGAKFADNSYSAEGSLEVSRVRMKDDKLLKPATKQFKIKFEDCLDGMGQPDMKVTELTLE